MGRFTLLGLYLLCQVLNTCVSQGYSNTCTECSRNPSSCRRISGLYTVTVLTEGTYNPVVEIPAPACRINITEFSSSSNYIALKTGGGEGIINSYWGLGQPGQYYGAGARFSYDRASGSCKGSCIYSNGPITENIVVQILYYDKNPGIAYEFILPNTVAFTPFDITLSKQKSAFETSSASSSSPSSPSLISSRYRLRDRSGQHHRRRHRHRQSHRRNDDSFEGEYYTGSQSSRSEGRPDETAALGSRVGVNYPSQEEQAAHDYTGSRYGSHTLGGRGLSYTAASDLRRQPRTRDRTSGRRVVDRYRYNPHTVRKVSSPQYVSQTSQRQTYPRQPKYQSFSATTTYLDEENAVEQFDGTNTLSNFNNHGSVNRGSDTGRSQYRWKISGFTECSKTCGGGVQKTNIVCISLYSRTQVVVTPENCANSHKPRTQTVECNTTPCEPGWEAEKWSECSVTCGSGTQTRKVECRQRFSPSLTMRVSADQCGLADKPAVAQQCEKELCSHWKIGPWNECNKECGGGERRRDIQCLDKFDSQIPFDYCSGDAPRATEPCNTQACSKQWWISDWSKECPESCGQGFKSRSALCLSDRGEVSSYGECDKRDLPAMEEACRSDSGCRGTWFAGPWGRCSVDCGEGRRSRQVVCLQRSISSLSIARDGECDSALKPESEGKCVNTDCNAIWYSSPWSECSVTCGDGFRTREVRCIEDKVRQSRRCVNEIKPKSKEVCSQPACTSNYQRTNRIKIIKRVRNENPPISSYIAEGFSDEKEISKEEDEVEGEEFNEEVDEENWSEDVEGDNNDEIQPQTPVTTEAPKKSDRKCKDTYWNCLMVIQSRLCSYDYYRSLCCHSCKKV